jgi:hypothetical protein
VAKWDREPSSQAGRRDAIGLTARLRDGAGWPVPRQWSVESETCLFVLQEFLLGQPVHTFNEATVERLLELHRRRIGLARPEDVSVWPNPLIETLLRGGTDYCLHSSLRDYDGRTASLLHRIIEIGRGAQAEDLRGGDIVHWDLHAGNLLQIDGRLSGIVDNDFVTVGDAAFDLATLAVSACQTQCTPGVREQLFEIAIESLDEARRSVYVGHLLLRVLDWAIRHERRDEVEFWLGQSARLLPY